MWERACPRFSGGPVTLFDARYTAIAGKPAPTFDGWCGQNAVPGQDPLWERACPRFSGGPVTLIDDRYTAIAGKSAPTFDGWCGTKLCARPRSTVGAGLLAKAVVQSLNLSTDTLPSRASPQGDCGRSKAAVFNQRKNSPGVASNCWRNAAINAETDSYPQPSATSVTRSPRSRSGRALSSRSRWRQAR